MKLIEWLRWTVFVLAVSFLAPSCFAAGNPILLVTVSSNPFTSYYTEILRAEGLNAFDTADISSVTATALAPYDVVILGQMSLTSAQVTTFTNWVNGGGNLIAMRPDKQLASLLGLGDTGTTLTNGYLLVNTASAPGAGIVGQTIQFHGVADQYSTSGATTVAALYSNATTATLFPAVSLRTGIGGGNGKAAAFTYDLSRSVVYTRQGNPNWVGQARIGQGGPVRAADMYYGNAIFDPQPDWVDLNKVAIPQADEQQRLLANLILYLNQTKKPLPRFWYLPFGKMAAVVMTGDDHANGGTAGRFDDFLASSPAGCSVANWECVRGTSYIYTATPLTNAQAVSYNAQGFEVALHVLTNCADYTPATIESFFADQLSDFAAQFPGLPAPKTNRTHCIAWSDWSSQATVELNHGIRLDTDYYYWPDSWVRDRPGMFTGSGMPMRFAQTDGTIIDVYQAVSQMTDESGQTFPITIDTLLDNAVGAPGYYGAFTANMHTDFNTGGSCSDVYCNSQQWADEIVASAQSRGVPVVSSIQMLQWLDGRNGSTFGSMSWSGNILSFTVTAATGANGLQAMVPTSSAVGSLSAITRGGSPVSYTVKTIKGIDYAFFSATSGSYQATYGNLLITAVTATPGTTTATITWTTDKSSNSRVDYGTSPTSLTLNTSNASMVTSHSITLTGLTAPTTYYYRVTSTDGTGNTGTAPPASDSPATFTTITATPPVITAVTAVPATGGKVTISWTTDKPSNSRVDYGTTTSLGTSSTDPTSVTSHSIMLSGLTVGTTYFYRVTSTDGLGNSASSPTPPGTASFVANSSVSVWSSSATPSSVDTDSTSVEVGLKFRSDLAGIVTGVRFYKDATNTGTHIGNLWSSTGTLLGTVTFSNETVSGWQQANFSTPISIAANTTYIISYFAPNGHYSVNIGYFNSAGVDNAPLHALASGVDGNNGVYRYGSASAFPNASFSNSNYWADLVFFDNVPPVISAVSATPAPTAATITWTTNEASNSRVDYGTSPTSLTLNATNASLVTSHSLNLTGLTTGVTYYYRVTSIDGFGNSTASPVSPATANFTTPAGSAPVISAVTATAGSGGTATITWTTDKVSDSRVDYGVTTSLGTTASNATQVTAHSVSLTGLTAGTTYFYRVTSADTLGNSSSSPVAPATASFVESNTVSVWSSSTTPGTIDSADPLSVEVGMKFRSDIAGIVTGVRFYKAATNTGTHVGHLWSSTGTLLGTVTFSGETTSGWQQANFSAPISITANTTYVISYFAPGGHYSVNSGFFTSAGVDNAPLHALADGVDGPNGVYLYGSSSGFPTSSFSGSNYWVDVVFQDNSVLTISSVAAAPSATTATITWTTNKTSSSRVDYGTSPTSLTLNQSNASLVTAHSITLTGLTTGATYYYRVTSVDSLGNSVSSPASPGTASFVAASQVSVWSSATTPGTIDSADPGAIEAGMKFRSDSAGVVTGVRFYKASTNTGAHIGNLWSSTGTLLGTVTFSNETASGWQQANFSTPISITANTTYIVSYFAPNGHYSVNAGFFSAGVDNAPLHALANGVDGANGVYRYGSASAFPNSSFNNSNYWVDLAFFDNVPPVISAVSATPAPTAATITWTTNEASNSRVDYGTSPTSLTLNATNASLVTSHSLNLTGLTTGVTYYYRVTSIDGFGNSAASPVSPATANFTTTAGSPPVISAVTATAGSGGTATITWTTDKLSDSRVDYGVTTSLGTTASNATQVTAHSVSLTGLTAGTTYFYRVTSADTLGNSSSSPVSPATSSFVEGTQVSVWSSTTTPGTIDSADPLAVEVGMKFRSDVAGLVTGVRFYKAATNTGTHVGHLWSSTGTLLGTVTFSGETASGWQQANFSAAVSIAANTTYIVSYFAPGGHYSVNSGFFASAGVDSTPLHALANGVDGSNGVYLYGSSGGFPNSSFSSSNYWVDLVFLDSSALTISSVAAVPSGTTATITWTTNKASSSRVDYGTSTTSLTLNQSNASLVTAHSITLTGLTTGTTYYYRVTSVDAQSNSVSSPASPGTASFTAAAQVSVWSPSTVPGTVDAADPSAVELGMKFRSDSAGIVTAVRFYKAATNTGTHIGNLWSSTGTLLGTVTFSGETASGWQQANFSTPVSIAANTTYIISYFAPNGHYSANNGFFTSAGVNNAPLHALASGVDGLNGVYRYGSSSGFPSSSWSDSNYWVDLVFSPQ